MATFQKLLAALSLMALIAGLPASVFGMPLAPDCEMGGSAAAEDGGCCDSGSGMDATACSMACAAGGAVVVHAFGDRFPVIHGATPIPRSDAPLSLASAPPDTGPPKAGLR